MSIPTVADLSEWPRLVAHRVFVTPEMAQDWIDSGNIENRYIRRTVIRRYADMMARGEWHPTHQGIAFSKRRLIDGQHRLMAVVQSGKPQWMVVFAEQSDDTYGTLDRGIGRTLRDDLGANNHMVDACVWIAKIASDDSTTRAIRPEAARIAMNAFMPSMEALHSCAASNIKGRTNSPIRAAVALRHYAASADDRKYVEAQWTAWVNLNIPDMSVSIQSLMKRNDKMGGAGGNAAAQERSAIAWIGFNPETRSSAKIIIHDLKKSMAEMREVALVALGR